MPALPTISVLLSSGADTALALSAPGRPGLRYDALRRQVSATIESLNRLGVGRDDTVAIVLPNGPEMASAFVSIAAGATTAPLNPGYTADEFSFYLQDLAARLLVVEAGSSSPAVA
ncbi:MAG: AMP-dependent synthetase, partial [Chromatiales bacterium]